MRAEGKKNRRECIQIKPLEILRLSAASMTMRFTKTLTHYMHVCIIDLGFRKKKSSKKNASTSFAQCAMQTSSNSACCTESTRFNDLSMNSENSWYMYTMFVHTGVHYYYREVPKTWVLFKSRRCTYRRLHAYYAPMARTPQIWRAVNRREISGDAVSMWKSLISARIYCQYTRK